MNPLAKELNEAIIEVNEHVYSMLSEVGKALFFPKGILSQSAEAKAKAKRHLNATIGMATEKGNTMHLKSLARMLSGVTPDEALTYAPSFGIPSLRSKWQELQIRKNPSLAGKPISLPIVTNAITHGLSVISDMWVNPGDTIVLPDKLWGNYNMIFSVRRSANVVTFPFFDDKWGFNLTAFEDCLKKEAQCKDKLIVILNFPNNPTGYTVSHAEGKAVADILTERASTGTNVIAVCDDAYFGLFYEEETLKESLFTKLVERDPRLLAIKLDAATKEDYVWGLRVGFLTYGISAGGDPSKAYDALEKKTAGAVRGSISNASHLSQELVLKAINSPTYWEEKKEKFQILKERAMEVKRVLKDPGYAEAFSAYPFNSGYFMCLRIIKADAEKLRVHLLEKYGLGLISLGATDLRVAFSSLEKEDIQTLFDIVLKGVQDLSS
jgi:aspartate/methionine/tyrosine aminotransferase